MEDSLYLDIYLDGSAYRNPGHEGGIGAIIQFSDERKPVTLQEKYSKTTNNRMELLAVVKAIEYARALNKREITLGPHHPILLSEKLFRDYNQGLYSQLCFLPLFWLTYQLP